MLYIYNIVIPFGQGGCPVHRCPLQFLQVCWRAPAGPNHSFIAVLCVCDGNVLKIICMAMSVPTLSDTVVPCFHFHTTNFHTESLPCFIGGQDNLKVKFSAVSQLKKYIKVHFDLLSRPVGSFSQ